MCGRIFLRRNDSFFKNKRAGCRKNSKMGVCLDMAMFVTVLHGNDCQESLENVAFQDSVKFNPD